MKGKPQLKQASRPQDWSSGLKAFMKRHDLSFRQLAGICSQAGQYISKSSVERLVNGKAEPRFIARIRPSIRHSLQAYLESLQKTEAEIEMEIRSIFCTPEIENMIAEARELPPEAQQFFGLRHDPFDPLEPRVVDNVFTTSALDKIARQVETAIRRQRFVAVIGDVGSGKTVLKKRIIDTVRRSSGRLRLFQPDFFNMDRVNSGSIVYWMLRQFDQRMPQDLISRASALKEILARLSDEGVRVALLFDECHRLDDRMITALKNFWELGSGGFDRYLGVVLFGQSSFKFTLTQHREIAQRCEVIEMPKLTKTAAIDYLKHRLTLAGGKVDRLFEPSALTRITSLSSTPLALGNIASAGLLKAYSLNECRVLGEHIPEINGDPQARSIRPAQK